MKASGSFLSVSHISAAYDDDNRVIEDLSFELQEGELGCLLGPSGCGKTTVLRSISGFQEVLEGQISLAGNLISQPERMLAPEKRGVGMVFQDHALFPHLSIGDNVGFGLGRLSKSEKNSRCAEMLDLVGMAEHQHKYPYELSGGQSQRVALARAIAPRPQLLLMDEPFSNLDSELRESLGQEVRSLLKDLGITAIMVTHDQHDAFALGDMVGVMNEGKLMQWASPFDLYHVPENRFVANFIGDGIFLKGKIFEENLVVTELGEIRGQSVAVQNIKGEVEVLIRPDDVRYTPSSSLKGKVIRKAFKGAQTLYTLAMPNGAQLMSLVPSHDDYEIGDIIGVSIEADHLVCFALNSHSKLA